MSRSADRALRADDLSRLSEVDTADVAVKVEHDTIGGAALWAGGVTVNALLGVAIADR